MGSYLPWKDTLVTPYKLHPIAACLGAFLIGLSNETAAVSSDPLFCDLSNDDFQVNAASPCAPENSPTGCDLIGALRVGCGVTSVPSGQVTVLRELMAIPNPFRGTARFEYESAKDVRLLNIFDANGRLIEQLSREDRHWEWIPGALVPAGVYFAVPQTGGTSDGVKVLYLK
jgi:hypothetical protein